GFDRCVGRRVQFARSGAGWARGSESGARPDAAATRREDQLRARQADAARKNGFRIEALPRPQAEARGRDFAYDGRDREEHALPGHAETARCAGGPALKSAEFIWRKPRRGWQL